LGLHLVLATQRPAGIVSADMRANIGLRIALRVRDRADSDDVIDAPDAAALDVRSPGRACIRSGDGILMTAQTAYLGQRAPAASADPAPVRVLPYELLRGPTSTQHAPAGADVALGSELDALVDAANGAAARLGIEAAPSPWLTPLPEVVTAASLHATLAANVAAAEGDSPTTTSGGILLGLVDVPHEQRQEVLTWHVGAAGHLGIAGGPRSGRSSALVTVALGLGRPAASTDLHVHVLQGAAGPCAGLAGLPHVGTVTSATDATLTRRLVTRLLRMVDGAAPGPRHTIVLVDGWEAIEERLAAVDHGSPVDDLYRLLRDGPAAGLQFVITGGRAVLSGRLPGLLGQRLVLHMPDPLDLTLAGVDPALAAVSRPPGRAIELATGRMVQLAVAGADPSAEATNSAIDEARAAHSPVPLSADGAADPTAPRPWRIAELPAEVDLSDLPDSRDALILGVGGDEATALAIASRHQRVLVAGTSRSGRSTTLAVIGERLIQNGRRVVTICPRRSPLSTWALARGSMVLTPQDDADLIAARRDDPDVCLLVDDVELVERSPAEEAIVQATRLVEGTTGFVAAAADLGRANAAFRGVVPEIARDGCGLLLGRGSATDGDVLGVRLDLPVERRPGRGHLVVDGVAQPFQVARLDVSGPGTSTGEPATVRNAPVTAPTG
jgi:S-DNA-T family DNA segregation ATPase FtsK/SpoIIIE